MEAYYKLLLGIHAIVISKTSAIPPINTLCLFINTEIPCHRKLFSKSVEIHTHTPLSFIPVEMNTKARFTWDSLSRGHVTPSGRTPYTQELTSLSNADSDRGLKGLSVTAFSEI